MPNSKSNIHPFRFATRSTMGHLFFPICRSYQCHASSSFMGSPTVSKISLVKISFYLLKGSTPNAIKLRIAVGAVYRILTLYLSTISQKSSCVWPCRNAFKTLRKWHLHLMAHKQYNYVQWPNQYPQCKNEHHQDNIEKHLQKCRFCPNHVSRTGMNHTFWFTGTTGCVKNKEHIFCIHFFSRKIRIT